MSSLASFPLRGVIGVVANGRRELDQAVDYGLHCVELRADLLLDGGLSTDDLFKLIGLAKSLGLACLFTLRHPTHGGKFPGDENQRIELSRRALKVGADLVDLEWQTPAAEALLGDDAPLVLSHHDFDNMLGAQQLKALTDAMLAAGPAAIKVVPTASNLSEAVAMLEWVQSRSGNVQRIGFAMGSVGACSRILSIAYGAPITYAAFGASVAPGQVPLGDLCGVYRAQALDAATRVHAIVGNDAIEPAVVAQHNQQLRERDQNAVCLPLRVVDLRELTDYLDLLRIDRLYVEEPFRRAALTFADESTAASDGAAVLEIDRSQLTRRVAAR